MVANTTPDVPNVKAMIPEHDVFVTDWRDARVVPMVYGKFDLDDFIDYIIEFLQFIGPNTHVIAVCQPSVPVLAAVAAMAAADDPEFREMDAAINSTLT